MYSLRALTPADIALVSRWRAMPHVVRWWGEPELEPAAANFGDGRIAMWIVEHDRKPFAYAQDYDVHGWPDHPFAHLPPGSRGIDQYIGEPDMLDRGHGTAFVRLHVERLLAAGARAIGTDPHPDNARARRAYAKAGFTITSAPIDTRWGRAVLMERWR